MDHRCSKHLYFLKFLVFNAQEGQRQISLEFASKEQIKCVIEVIGNILVGNIKIEDEAKESLKPHKQNLILLWKSDLDLEEKRQILVNETELLNLCFLAAEPFLFKVA